MSSKLSFRARALDATKALPIYHAEDIPDLADFAAINRTVPQMPTGMEKEEENASSVLVRHFLQNGGLFYVQFNEITELFRVRFPYK